MKILLFIALAALCLLPVLAQPLSVGGEWGRSWLNNNGDKNVVKQPGGGLWSWGTIPKGQYLSNGTLQPIGVATVFFPSFAESSVPLMINRTTNLNGYFPPDFNSPYFMDDPWMISQITGRPVVYRT